MEAFRLTLHLTYGFSVVCSPLYRASCQFFISRSVAAVDSLFYLARHPLQGQTLLPAYSLLQTACQLVKRLISLII